MNFNLQRDLMGISGGVDAYFKTVPSLLSMPGGIPQNTRERLVSSLNEYPLNSQEDTSKGKKSAHSELPDVLLFSQFRKIILISICLGFWFFLMYCFSLPLFWPFIKRRANYSTLILPIVQSQEAQIRALENRIETFEQAFDTFNNSISETLSNIQMVQTEGETSRNEKINRFSEDFKSVIANEIGSIEKTISNAMKKELSQFHSIVARSEDIIKSTNIRLDEIENKIQMSKDDSENKVSDLKSYLNNRLQQFKDSTTIISDENNSTQLPSEQLVSQVQKLYDKVVYDTTRRVDWASASLGASIIEKFTTAGHGRPFQAIWRSILVAASKVFTVNRLLLPPVSKPADIVIGRGVYTHVNGLLYRQLHAGDCFAFTGQKGNITIQLPFEIYVNEVHIDHLPPQLLPLTATVPKRFSVYIDSSSNPSLSSPPLQYLGSFEFKYPKVYSQSFLLDSHPKPLLTSRVRFEFSENFGGRYTCVYRIRIHGQMPAEFKSHVEGEL